MKIINTPTVLTIAGSDSSGGAGIQADIKTISALGCYAASVLTALTAQNTQGVQAIYPISPGFVEEQMESVFSDLSIRAVKIGMLYDENIIEVVAKILQKFKPPVVVLDPVMVSKNGHALLKLETLEFLKKNLFPQVSLITPNIIEAEKLLHKNICNPVEQQAAAIALGQLFSINVLVKGGHLKGNQSSDVLYIFNEDRCEWFFADRIETENTHGTGCTLSSAIAVFLCQNYSFIEAIASAKKYLTQAISSAQSFIVGHGTGPLNHFYSLKKNYVI